MELLGAGLVASFLATPKRVRIYHMEERVDELLK
jgi:hypothetical protein